MKGRSTLRQVAGRVGKWMVFHGSVIFASVYAPDGPRVCCSIADTGGESLILRYREWIASFLAMTGTISPHYLSIHCSLWTYFRDYFRSPIEGISEDQETMTDIHHVTLQVFSASELFRGERFLAWYFPDFCTILVSRTHWLDHDYLSPPLRFRRSPARGSICRTTRMGRI